MSNLKTKSQCFELQSSEAVLVRQKCQNAITATVLNYVHTNIDRHTYTPNTSLRYF